MRDLEGFQQIAPQFARAVDRQGPGLLEPALDGVARQVVHHVERQALTLVHVVDWNDVGMTQPAEDPSLLDELRLRFDRPQLRPQDLDGHRAIEPDVARQVHGSHAAACELAQQLVVGRQSRTQALKESRHVTRTGEHPGPCPESQTAPSVSGPFHCGTSVAEVTAP